MNNRQKLIIEVLNGPLDGTTVVLAKETAWSKTGPDPLSFPWDEELGAPQAVFRPDADGWQVEGGRATHGTYVVNRSEKVTAAVPVQAGDLLKASATWLLVRALE